MGTRHLPGGAFAFSSILVLALVGSFDGRLSLVDAAMVVTGAARCLDCSRKSSNHLDDAFKGLQVAIKCRATVGANYETTLVSSLDSHGSFAVPLSTTLLADNSSPSHDCVAELQAASTNRPCHNQAEPSKIVFNKDEKAGVTSATAGTIPFSSTVCASPVDISLTFFHKPWLWHKYLSFFHPKPYYSQPYYKPAPQITPMPEYKPPTGPVYTKPAPTYKPPAGPVYYKPAPTYTPAVGPVPTYKPPVKPVPTYTTPSVPYYKSGPVFYGHPHLWKLWKGKHHPFFPPVKH